MSGLKSIKLIGGFTILFFMLSLFSCSKKSNDTADNYENEGGADLETVSEDNFTETNEDLLTVDYKEFYDQLAPHGEWIEVTANDIGMDESGTASGISPVRKHARMSFADFFGVKEANAYDIDLGAFFVWKPAPNLAVGITTGDLAVVEPEPVYYRPYTNGQWVYTDAGWYFQAATPVEEVTHHYGRWAYTPTAGWVWVPGRVWSPAWVDFREDDTYLAWQPIPPSVYLVNNVAVVPPTLIVEDRYVVVEKRYFVEPMVYQHVYLYDRHPGKFKIKEWRRLDGVMVVNNTVITRGPDVSIIQSVIGREIAPVRIDRVTSINKVEYSNNTIRTYVPEFKKVKEKGNRKNSFSKPEKFERSSNVIKDKTSRNESSGKQKDNSLEKNSKTRLSDDGNMYNGKNNKGNENKGNNKNDNNWNKGSDKKKNDNSGNKNKGNDNKGNDKKKNDNSGNKNKGNDNKGNDNKGKDKGKGNGDNNKGNDNKGGNDKVGKDKSGQNDKGGNNKGGNDKGNKKGKK